MYNIYIIYYHIYILSYIHYHIYIIYIFLWEGFSSLTVPLSLMSKSASTLPKLFHWNL